MEPNRTCIICGKKFYSRPSKQRTTCSMPCRNEYYKQTNMNSKKVPAGSNHSRWAGGITKSRGYRMKVQKDHPKANKDGYVYEHRLIMEEHIGRYLTNEEVVHHINGEVTDNRIENLMLFASEREHKKHHEYLKKIGKDVKKNENRGK